MRLCLFFIVSAFLTSNAMAAVAKVSNPADSWALSIRDAGRVALGDLSNSYSGTAQIFYFDKQDEIAVIVKNALNQMTKAAIKNAIHDADEEYFDITNHDFDTQSPATADYAQSKLKTLGIECSDAVDSLESPRCQIASVLNYLIAKAIDRHEEKPLVQFSGMVSSPDLHHRFFAIVDKESKELVMLLGTYND